MTLRLLVRGEQGYTILETFIAMFIIAIVASSSIAFFSDLGPSFDRWNSRSTLLTDLRYAQATAIEEGCRMTMEVAADGSMYSFGCDYLDYDYIDPINYDKEFLSRTLPNSVSLSLSDALIFNAKGQSVTSDGQMTDIQIQLTYLGSGGNEQYFTGTILATGVFVND